MPRVIFIAQPRPQGSPRIFKSLVLPRLTGFAPKTNSSRRSPEELNSKQITGMGVSFRRLLGAYRKAVSWRESQQRGGCSCILIGRAEFSIPPLVYRVTRFAGKSSGSQRGFRIRPLSVFSQLQYLRVFLVFSRKTDTQLQGLSRPVDFKDPFGRVMGCMRRPGSEFFFKPDLNSRIPFPPQSS